MNTKELNILLEQLCKQPHEQQWLEFKLNKGSITNEQIGEYISSLSNGATIANKPHGFMIWGVEDATHIIKGTNFTFAGAKQGNQDLELWIRNLLHPRSLYIIYFPELQKLRGNLKQRKRPASTSAPPYY